MAPKEKCLAVCDIGRLDGCAEGKTETGVFVPVADMGGRNPVGTTVEIEEAAKPALDIVDRCAALGAFPQRHGFGAILVADRQQFLRDVVKRFVPTDALPAGIGIAFGSGAFER